MKYTDIKQRIILNLIPKDRNIKILDMGCQYGESAKIFYDAGYKNIIGFDINKKYIDIAKRNNPQIKFSVGDMRDIDYSGYDMIYSWSVVYCIENLEELLEKISKQMKKGAALIFIIPNLCCFTRRIKCMAGINPVRHFVAKRQYCFRDMKKILKNLKFSKKEIMGTGYDSFKNFLFPMPIKTLSSHIIVKLIK